MGTEREIPRSVLRGCRRECLLPQAPNRAQGFAHGLESSETDLYPQKRPHGQTQGNSVENQKADILPAHSHNKPIFFLQEDLHRKANYHQKVAW